MLNRVEVRNFQSVHRATVALGRFTVLTGPTGSGKSAVFRAVRLLARNARGTDYVTAGAASCSVATGDGDWAVRITRSVTSRGKNEYLAARRVGEGWTPVRYTKLQGQVPGPVAEIMALSDLNFAGQHDPPFLLTAPGTVIARQLGELTNVSLVLGAAAEANRVRKQLARDLDAARARRDQLLAEAQEFADLAGRRKAATAAEEALARAQALVASLQRLRALAGRLAAAEQACTAARATAARQAPPSLDELDGLAARVARLRLLAGRLAEAERAAARFGAEAGQARGDEEAAHAAVHAALKAAGQCPTCGSVIA
jgi:DNA repair ATPase RecN